MFNEKMTIANSSISNLTAEKVQKEKENSDARKTISTLEAKASAGLQALEKMQKEYEASQANLV